MALLHSGLSTSAGHMAQVSVHSQMRRRRRESNKDGAFTLTCFLLLLDTWPRLLYTLKCGAGAESLTKMALLNSHVFYFFRTRGPGFCALPNAAQAQRVGQNSLGQSVQRVHLPQLDSCRRDGTMPALTKLAPLLHIKTEFTVI
jgi:hypothetical protein